jgi:hypothetical protein
MFAAENTGALSSEIPLAKDLSRCTKNHFPKEQTFYGINFQERNSKESRQMY